MPNIDEFRKYDTDADSLLTWEIIESRGVASGDLMTLWVNACALSMGVPAVKDNGRVISESLAASGFADKAVEVAIEYDMLIGYICRDVAEITKFLVRKGFHFPDISPDEFDAYLK